jgi:hypothetical protein
MVEYRQVSSDEKCTGNGKDTDNVIAGKEVYQWYK